MRILEPASFSSSCLGQEDVFDTALDVAAGLGQQDGKKTTRAWQMAIRGLLGFH
jgi:hypothetical protein